MYSVGSLFYAIYFFVSFPMFFRMDENPKVGGRKLGWAASKEQVHSACSRLRWDICNPANAEMSRAVVGMRTSAAGKRRAITESAAHHAATSLSHRPSPSRCGVLWWMPWLLACW